MSAGTGTPVSMTDEPTSARDEHTRDPWCRLRLRGFRQVETLHGVAWSATITHDGEPVGWVEDGGDGGPLLVRWSDRTVEAAARAAATRLAGQIGRGVGDPVENFLEQLAAVHDLARRRTVLWRVPGEDGAFWEDYRFRSFPRSVTRAEALTYLRHPARAHWQAELWDQARAWWTPVADLR